MSHSFFWRYENELFILSFAKRVGCLGFTSHFGYFHLFFSEPGLLNIVAES